MLNGPQVPKIGGHSLELTANHIAEPAKKKQGKASSPPGVSKVFLFLLLAGLYPIVPSALETPEVLFPGNIQSSLAFDFSFFLGQAAPATGDLFHVYPSA